MAWRFCRAAAPSPRSRSSTHSGLRPAECRRGARSLTWRVRARHKGWMLTHALAAYLIAFALSWWPAVAPLLL